MLYTTSSSFTRPADTNAYASGDLVANSTTASSVVPLSWVLPAQSRERTNFIRRVKLETSGTSTTNASFRVHFYSSDPSASSGIANGDNGAWSTNKAGYLGAVDVTIDKAFADGAAGHGTPNTGSEISFVVSGGATKQVLYGLIEARAAYTPTSGETITVTPELYTA